MAPKIIEKVLVALHLREKKQEKYDYDAHMHLEAQGFYNEGLEGTYKCPTKGCRNPVNVYRQVRRTTQEFHDVIRFEQTIPVHPSSKTKVWKAHLNANRNKKNKVRPKIIYTSPGKVSISIPVVWNAENRKQVSEKEYVGERKTVNGQTYTLIKHRHFASLECVKCMKELHLWDELRRYDGEDGMRWFLTRKEDNVSKKDLEGGGSDAETLVDV